jgi:hypothetical protein
VSRTCHYVIHSCVAFYRISAAFFPSGTASSLIAKQHRRYPEVLAVLHGEPRRMGRRRKRPSFETPRKRAAPQDDGYITVNDVQMRKFAAMFINSKPHGELPDRGEGPLSGAAAPYAAKRWGSSMELNENRGGGTMAVLDLRC